MPARISLGVDPVPTAARTARHTIAARLHLPADITANVDIIVGELLANAVLHGTPPIQATVTLQGRTLRIAVHDHDPQMGSPRADSRGLIIVTRLTTDWGVTHDGGGGKTVWAELPAPPANPALPMDTEEGH